MGKTTKIRCCSKQYLSSKLPVGRIPVGLWAELLWLYIKPEDCLVISVGMALLWHKPSDNVRDKENKTSSV